MSRHSALANGNKEIYIYTFIIDEASIVLAFLSAILIRYNAMMRWVDYNSGIYVSMILTATIYQIMVLFLYDLRKPSIIHMDPWENGMRIVKSRGLLTVLFIAYLFITQRSVLASRIVLCIFLILSVIYGYLFRMLFRHSYINKQLIDNNENNIVLDLSSLNSQAVLRDVIDEKCDSVLIISRGTEKARLESVVGQLESRGIRTYIALESNEYLVRSGIVTDVTGYVAFPAFVRANRFSLFGVKYCVSRIEEAVYHVLRHLDQLKGEYICFSNVHTCVMAKESPEYADVLNSAALVFPDGNPIARLQKRFGYDGGERVAGPDFMANMFRDTQDGKISHYFYGSTEETLKALRVRLEEKYPGINIKGMYSPPFRELTVDEDEEDIRRINESGADVLWVGLGAPKQEKWMNVHKGKINAVMMGVGAGFDFHAGTIDRAPRWLQRIGLEWLYRLFQDPERLFKRYFITNFKFIWYLLHK